MEISNIITEIIPMSKFNSRLDRVEERNNKAENESEDNIWKEGHKDSGKEIIIR